MLKERTGSNVALRGDMEDELIPRAGRLDESAELAHIAQLLRSPRGPWVFVPAVRPNPKPSRPTAATNGPGFRALSVGSKPASTVVTTFHFRQASTSRRPAPELPRDVRDGARVALFPKRSEKHLLKSIESARQHRGKGVWSLPAGHEFLRSPRGEAMRSAAAHAAAFVGRESDPKKRALDQVRKHQRYIERSGGFERRANEVEADEKGQILVGNIGATPHERAAFWRAASAAETRRDARLQNRIVLELPHWISAADRRQIVERLGAVFEQHKLAWFGACHRPDKHGDKRNFHAHFLIGTRPIQASPSIAKNDGWIFVPKKDRDLQGATWIRRLRQEFARIVNEVAEAAAARDSKPVERIFFPGRAIEIGIMDTPGTHLGPARAAVLRRGIGTPPRTPLRNLFDLLEGFARAHAFDKAALTRATDLRDLIFETLARHPRNAQARLAPGSAIIDAEKAVAECGRLLREAVGTAGPAGTAHPSKPSRVADLVRAFDEAAHHIAAAHTALDTLLEVERVLAPVEPTEVTFPFEPKRLAEVDPNWALREIAQRLDKHWVPREVVDGRETKAVRLEQGRAEIVIGDRLKLTLSRHHRTGWRAEFADPADWQNLKSASYERRFWFTVVTTLIDTVTLRLGKRCVEEILDRHGVETTARDKHDDYEIRRSDGLLRIAADGRYAAVYGSNPTLHAVFRDIERARDRKKYQTAVLEVLASKHRPVPLGDLTLPGRPVLLSELARQSSGPAIKGPLDHVFATSKTEERAHRAAVKEFHPAPPAQTAVIAVSMEALAPEVPPHVELTIATVPPELPSPSTAPRAPVPKNAGTLDRLQEGVDRFWQRLKKPWQQPQRTEPPVHVQPSAQLHQRPAVEAVAPSSSQPSSPKTRVSPTAPSAPIAQRPTTPSADRPVPEFLRDPSKLADGTVARTVANLLHAQRERDRDRGR